MPHPKSETTTRPDASSDPLRWRLAVIALVCFATGYFVADDSARVQSLQAEIDRLPKSSGWRSPPVQRPSFLKTASSTNPPGLRPVTPEPLPDLITRLGITPGELTETEEINARQRKGEYILKLERPTTRKFLDYDFKQIVAERAAALAERYDPVFTELGLSTATREQLKTHLGKIQRASLELTVAKQQMEEARQAYDKTIRSTLSGADYERYRGFEAARQATLEFERIQGFAQSSGQGFVDATQRDHFIAVIQEQNHYLTPTKDGPYDPERPAIIGRENVLREMETQRSNLQNLSARLQQRLAENGFDSDQIGLINAYYNQEIENRNKRVEQLAAGSPGQSSTSDQP